MASTVVVHQAGWWQALWHQQKQQQQQQQQQADSQASQCDIDGQAGGGRRRRVWQRAAAPAKALLHCTWTVLGLRKPLLTATVAATGFLATATACAFLPAAFTYPVGVAALASRGWPPWPTRPRHNAPAPWLRPFQRLRGPAMVLACMRLVLPPAFPAVWRALRYWQRSLPILARFLRTRAKARRLQHQGRHVEAQALWQRRHQEAAEEIFSMLADIQGFYVKLAQILATKTEMLPKVYTDSLQRLMDRLPPVPWSSVQPMLEKELGRPLGQVFESIETFPLASATVAQVHVGQLLGSEDGQLVAVKVQRRRVRGMMKADLANMRLFVEMCNLFHISLGFDLGSVVREYQQVVPDEFRFDREATAMVSIRESLQRYAQEEELADLRHVIVPAVYDKLSTERVLVMQLLEGVPLLHASGMSQHIRTSLLQALVLSYGVQILEQGLFHTDPHPGNLLACIDTLGDVAVGICDFGQVKRLSAKERLRFAQLVVALASRDNQYIRKTCRDLGVRIENCGPDFEEIAAYILFDTRMDIPEARESPLSPNAHAGWRTARVPALPQDLFFIMRVITLLRGVLASMHCFTISSALLWEPLARKVLNKERAAVHAAEEAQKELKALRGHKRTALQSHLLSELTIRLADRSTSVGGSSAHSHSHRAASGDGRGSVGSRRGSSGQVGVSGGAWERLIAVPASNPSDISSSTQLQDDVSLAGMLMAGSPRRSSLAGSGQQLVRQQESTDTLDLDVSWWNEEKDLTRISGSSKAL